MITELYNGRPSDESGRLAKEIRVYDLLDSLGIEYCRIDHTPAGKMEACDEIDKKLGVVICKNLFLCNRTVQEYFQSLREARGFPSVRPKRWKNFWT